MDSKFYYIFGVFFFSRCIIVIIIIVCFFVIESYRKGKYFVGTFFKLTFSCIKHAQAYYPFSLFFSLSFFLFFFSLFTINIYLFLSSHLPLLPSFESVTLYFHIFFLRYLLSFSPSFYFLLYSSVSLFLYLNFLVIYLPFFPLFPSRLHLFLLHLPFFFPCFLLFAKFLTCLVLLFPSPSILSSKFATIYRLLSSSFFFSFFCQLQRINLSSLPIILALLFLLSFIPAT